MRKLTGFTLFELIMFIMITAIIASGIVLSFMNTLKNAPSVMQQTIATQTAKQCAEWFLGQRNLNGYSSVNCVSNVPSFCSAPAGYNIAITCAVTTISGDNNYKTFTIRVSGQADASLSLLLANY